MIKTVVFDLDNTLLPWKSEYIISIKQALQAINYPYTEEIVNKIDHSFEAYEDYLVNYDKEIFLNFVNEFTGLSLPLVFVDKIVEIQKSCYNKFTESELAVLEYLSNKYELIVLTNWFTETQRARLENAGGLKYFKIVIGGDQHAVKPSLDAFNIVSDHYKDCVMIGDSLEKDIKPALQLGMRAIMKTNKSINDKNIKTIRSLEELREVL